MDMKVKYTIGLERYGVEGQIVLSAPGLRRMNEMKNAVGKSATISRVGGEVTLENALQGDLELLSILVYVEKAPFRPTVEGFLAFCDKLDERNNGDSLVLFEEMKEKVGLIDERSASPLADCPSQETQNSD